MEFTLNEKLDIISGKPFGTASIFEAQSITIDDPTELGLDKRLGITREWKRYSDGLRRIEKIRDASRANGLDKEFRDLIQASVSRDIDEVSIENPLTYTEVHTILMNLQQEHFDEKVREREHELKTQIQVPRKTASRELKNAVALLKDEAKGHYSGPDLSMMQLLNPKNIDPNVPLKMFSADPEGKKQVIVLDNNRSLIDQFKDIVAVISRGKYLDLSEKMRKTFDARVIILSHYWPHLTQGQVKYTAALYTIRNIADEITDREVERADELKKKRRREKRSKQPQK